MPGDYTISLCSSCEFRPIDPETSRPVEGGLRIAHRKLDEQSAVVIYSEVDPRINNQLKLARTADRSRLVREANYCVPLVEGLGTGLGDTETRIKQARSNAKQVRCPLASSVSFDSTLPQGLLYQTELA